ncbi:MAG: tetratricopeptide repeat protein [Chromatiales bacterium]|nr:tetratricopeptide repeat protein [Chromatiales bacterium]
MRIKMVDVNLSEEEQVEALKKWWRENGKSVIGGAVIGLGIVFGWRAWVDHNQGVAEQASYQFEQLNKTLAVGANESAVKQAEQIIADYADSTYAVFAALNLAKVKLEQDDKAGARVELKWALEHSPDPGLKQIAGLRLARLMLDDGDIDGAATLVAQTPLNSFKGELAELRGDIALAKGDKAAARSAYQEALDSLDGNTAIIKMKLDDLAVATNNS